MQVIEASHNAHDFITCRDDSYNGRYIHISIYFNSSVVAHHNSSTNVPLLRNRREPISSFHRRQPVHIHHRLSRHGSIHIASTF